MVFFMHLINPLLPIFNAKYDIFHAFKFYLSFLNKLIMVPLASIMRCYDLK